MKTARPLLTFALVATLAGVVSAGVTVDYKKSADFDRYRTFAWVEGIPAQNAEIEKYIRAAVEQELTEKGLSKASGRPDVYVQVLSRGRQGSVQDQDILGRPPTFDPSRSGAPSELSDREVQLGDLVVILQDGQTRLQVWQAVGSRIFGENPDKANKKIQKMVRRMFRDYPPQ